MPPQPGVHIGVSAWIDYKGDVLLIRRVGKGLDGYGTYALPGGWLDRGESVYDTAVRETMEETGIEVHPREILDVVTCPTDDGRWVATVVVDCSWWDGTPHVTEPDKCADVGWYKISDLEDGKLSLFAPLAEFIRRA